jgi:hypothetical protein
MNSRDTAGVLRIPTTFDGYVWAAKGLASRFFLSRDGTADQSTVRER